MKALWTEAAVAQLEAIHEYLAQTSPEYARRIVDRITKRSMQLSAFPFSGRMVSEYELNEVREVIEGSFRIIYLIKENEDQIEVLAVFHSAREGLSPLG